MNGTPGQEGSLEFEKGGSDDHTGIRGIICPCRNV